jgi:hypothetical protein
MCIGGILMNEMFYCKSLNLVAYIMSNGVEPHGFNDRGRNLTFYFVKDDRLKEIIDSYNNNTELKNFISAFKQVKDLIKNNKTN